jgi:hypothetical protein
MGWKGILGFDYGVVQAPLGPDISGPELAAAVANAGGIGLLRLPDWVPRFSPPLWLLRNACAGVLCLLIAVRPPARSRRRITSGS